MYHASGYQERIPGGTLRMPVSMLQKYKYLFHELSMLFFSNITRLTWLGVECVGDVRHIMFAKIRQTRHSQRILRKPIQLTEIIWGFV